MRRTARALSLAAATGAALAALAPAAWAGAVLDDGASWGTTSPSPCPRPEGHAWEPDAALDPAGPEAVVPESTGVDESGAELDAGLDTELGTDADAGPDADLGADRADSGRLRGERSGRCRPGGGGHLRGERGGRVATVGHRDDDRAGHRLSHRRRGLE